MLIFYFSGTGNTKYIAEMFAEKMGAEPHSIEEKIAPSALISNHDTIAFCYPIYGSRVPRIMRDFVTSIRPELKDKKIIIFCTQMLFSGDGARAFTDLFTPEKIDVIYAEHFSMPDNICNFAPLPLASKKSHKRYKLRAERKMNTACENIKNGVIKKRGFNTISKALGLLQGVFLPKMEERARKDVRINQDCNRCKICVSVCPMNNLTKADKKIQQNGNCTLCYRCVNLCPQKAITVFVHGKVKKQYKLT